MRLHHLPTLPFEGEGLARDTRSLERLADAYGDAGAQPTWEGFLFGFVPLRLFDAVLVADAAPVPPPGFLFALYASGVLGGWWLRRALRAAQPEGMLARMAVAPDRGAFDEALARAEAALDAAAGDDAVALAHAEEALPGHAASFGYNLGYLLEIVEHPPEARFERSGLVAERGLLDATIEPRRLRAWRGLREAIDHLDDPPEGRWERLAETLRETQEEELARGREVWSTGLSVQGMDEATYATLLDVSASFLEVAQAAALTAAWAVAEADAEAARRSALASAGIGPWLGGYALALLDPRYDEAATPPWPTLG